MNLFRYIKGGREELIDAFQIPYGGYNIINQGENFIVVYLKEPIIKFSEHYKSTMFPRDFPSVRQFYTSSSKISAVLRFYYANKNRQVIHLLESLNKLVEQKLNFDLKIERYPVRTYQEVCKGILDALQNISSSGSKENIIIGGAIESVSVDLCENFHDKVKALSVITRVPTHLIKVSKLNDIIASECEKEAEASRLHECKAYRAYILNNIVQLYAKAGGIPWIPGEEDLLRRKAIVGIATARMKTSDKKDYIVGVAFSIAYLGREVRGYITAGFYDFNSLDRDFLRSRGIYVPRKTIRELISNIAKTCGKWQINQYIIFQSPIVHSEELEGLKEVLGHRKWILVHVKSSGFTKRVYDKKTPDWGPYRGLCILDRDYIDVFKEKGIMKALLVATGWIKVKNTRSGVKEKYEIVPLYKATPKPLELEIYVDPQDAKNYKEPLKLATYISRVILLLGKLDWEAYTNWPKIPFVIKYARRLAEIIAKVDKDTKEKLLKNLTSPIELRFIM